MTTRVRYVLGVLGMSAGYALTGLFAVSLHEINELAVLTWIPGAIGLGVCLLYGVRWWPGIAIGTALIMLVRGRDLWPAGLIIITVDVLEVMLACWLLRRVLDFRPELDRVRDVIYFVEVAVAVTLLSATASLTAIFAVGTVDADRVTHLWSRWWWSHLSADLIVLPAILTWARRARAPRIQQPRNPVEAVALTFTVLVVVLIVLGRWLPTWLPASNAPYYLLPMLLWAGVRFGPRGAALASLGASVTAIVAETMGLGPFDRLIDMQTFVAISSVSTLMLSALAIERVRAFERMGAIEHAALDGIVTIDGLGHVLEMNPAAERLFGLNVQEVIGRDLAALMIPARYRDAYHRWLRDFTHSASEAAGSRYRVKAWRAIDNREFPVEVAITRVPVENEVLLTGFVRDVSAEQDAEDALRAAHEQLEHKVQERTCELLAANRELEWRETLMRQAEELAHLGSFEFGLAHGQLHWSDELFRIYGREPGKFQPSFQTFLDAVHPDDRGKLQARVERAAATRGSFEFEERIARPDGSTRVLQTIARVFVDGHGRPVKLAGCCQDITERKQAEATKSRLVQIVESSDDAMIGLSLLGLIETWNPAAAKLFGYALAEVRGKSCLSLVREASRSQMENVFIAIRAGERVRRYELECVRKDGSVFDASVTTSSVIDAAGAIVGMSKTLRDVTPQKLYEKQMRSSLREKEVLLREIHHRVKNNLQVIASLLNIQVSTESSDRGLKGLLESQNRIQSMALVHQLLYQSKDLAQIDAGEYLTNLTNRIVQTYNIAPERIAVHVSASPLQLDVDRAIPCGLIVNELLTNALTHAFPGHRKGHVTVAVEHSDGTVTLTVSDDGVGMPPDVSLDRIKSFGLRIAYTLAKQLDGQLTLARERGTVFRVVFPNVPHVAQAA